MFDSLKSGVTEMIEAAASPHLENTDNQTLLSNHTELRSLIDQLTVAADLHLAEVDRRQAHTTTHYTSTTAYLMGECDMRAGRAKRRVSTARTMSDMPVATKVAADGGLSTDKTELLVSAQNASTDLFERDETILVDMAETMHIRQFRQAVDYWKQLATDTNLTFDQQYEQSFLHISKTFDGMVKVDGWLDPERGARLIAALRRHTPPPTSDDPAPLMQRRIDTLIGLIEQEPTALASDRMIVHLDAGTLIGPERHADSHDQRPDEPTQDTAATSISETAQASEASETANQADTQPPHTSTEPSHEAQEVAPTEALSSNTAIHPDRWNRLSETDDGTVLPPAVIERIACNPILDRLISSNQGEILNYQRLLRLVPPRLRRAIIARDRTCVIPGCHRPHQWTDVHHIIPWHQGGETSTNNCILLCRYHHTMVHQKKLTITGPAHQADIRTRDGTKLE